MGKAADNERIKLTATLRNNISVGLVIGGAAIPILAVYSRLPDLSGWPEMLLPLSGAVTAFVAAALMHWWALAALRDIKD
jgi:hypothetical protein